MRTERWVKAVTNENRLEERCVCMGELMRKRARASSALNENGRDGLYGLYGRDGPGRLGAGRCFGGWCSWLGGGWPAKEPNDCLHVCFGARKRAKIEMR